MIIFYVRRYTSLFIKTAGTKGLSHMQYSRDLFIFRSHKIYDKYNENKTASNGIQRWCLQTRRHRRRRLYSVGSSDSPQPTTRRRHYHFFFGVYLFIYASTTAASGAYTVYIISDADGRQNPTFGPIASSTTMTAVSTGFRR